MSNLGIRSLGVRNQKLTFKKPFAKSQINHNLQQNSLNQNSNLFQGGDEHQKLADFSNMNEVKKVQTSVLQMEDMTFTQNVRSEYECYQMPCQAQ